MPGLPKAGVQLIAEGAAKYFGDLARGVTAQQQFSSASSGAASAVNAFGGAASKNAAKVQELTDKLIKEIDQSLVAKENEIKQV